MEYRFLGRTGMRVSELCLGAMTFGREAERRRQPADAGSLYRRPAETSSIPPMSTPPGVSEEIIGRWLKGQTARRRW